ncbi:MAG: O-antigen ligase family protein [Rhizobiaceae bacterium]|nr:O-antigen ligase family protein [Rhizobiaceae bacterium]
MASRAIIAATYALAAVSLWNPGGADPTPPALLEMLRYALFGSLAGFIVVATILQRGIVISRAPEWLMLAAFLIYTSLSAIWSDGGASAAIKGALIFTSMLVAMSLATSLGLSVMLRVFYNAMTVFVFVSLFVVFAFPERGIETGWLLDGDWRGIAGQKNGLGAVSSMVFVAALALPLVTWSGRPATGWTYMGRLAVIVAAGVCAVNSGSRGALVIGALGVALVVAARLPGAFQRVGLVVLVLLAIPVVVLAGATLGVRVDLIDVLGQTIDTNGRMTLWLYGLTQLDGRELLGFGVGGFWTPERIIAFQDLHGWVLDNFHNGYVTILVEGGIIGLGLLLLAAGFLMLLYVVAVGSIRDGYVALALAYTGMFLVGNFTENEVGRSTSLTFLIFLSISFAARGRIEEVLASRGTRKARVDAAPRIVHAAPTLS